MISRQAAHLIHIPSGVRLFLSPSSFLRNSRIAMDVHLIAVFSDRTNRRRASGPVREDPCRSTIRTQALPTTTASACIAAERAIAGVETPNPIATGSRECFLTSPAQAAIPGGKDFRTPVTPVTEIIYRNPDPNRDARRTRSGPLVGATSGIQSSPALFASGAISPDSSTGRSTTRTPSAPARTASLQNA